MFAVVNSEFVDLLQIKYLSDSFGYLPAAYARFLFHSILVFLTEN